MLTIEVGGQELFDSETEVFVQRKPVRLVLEHSLRSLSKWESKFEKPFLSREPHTNEELYVYVECMVLEMDGPDYFDIRDYPEVLAPVNEYINKAGTATTFTEHSQRPPSREVITAELIYFWMLEHGIPFETDRWNLNQLFALIRICGIKRSKKKGMNRREIAEQNRMLNAQRRAQLGTSG